MDLAAETLEAPVDRESPTDAASGAFRELARAIQGMDVDGTLALYDDGPGFSHAFGAELIEGRAAFDIQIRDGCSALREIPTWEVDQLTATELDPNTVLIVARIREVAIDTTGARRAYAGVLTNVFVRRDDGWRISYGHSVADAIDESGGSN